MLNVILEFVSLIPTLTFDDVTFKDVTQGRRGYDNSEWTVASPTKKGTLVVTSGNGYLKTADLTLTSAGDTDWVGSVKVLVQNVRDLDTGAYAEGFRKLVNSDADVGDKIAVMDTPGSLFEIGAQNSTDRQAGYDSAQAYTAGDRLYAAVNTATGAQNGGIWNIASQATSGGTVYCMPVGEARNTLAAGSTSNLKVRFNPGFIHGSLYTS